MIGGIFCQVVFRPSGVDYDRKLLNSIRTRLYHIYGKDIAVFPYFFKENVDTAELESISQAAADSFRYISARTGRDFNNDTIDLLRSMGVGIFKGDNLLETRNFGASRAHREATYKPRKRRHPNPTTRFDTFIKGIQLFGGSSGDNLWRVVYAATMPYATRLEVGDKNGNLKPRRVLIGNINSCVNAFVRNFFGRDNKNIPHKIYYGYYFETGGAVKLISTGTNKTSK